MDSKPKILIWDLPLRAFHWLFMAAIIGAIISGKAENLALHERFGMAVMGLLAFRIIWGFIGGRTARFAHFIKGVGQVRAVLAGIWKRRPSDYIGHSALGGWATLALLGIPLLLALTGSVSTDGILYQGPFAHLLPGMGKQFAELHHSIEPLLFLVIFLHLAALALYYFWLKKNLIQPMLGGAGQVPPDLADQGGHISLGRQILGLVLLAACLGLGQWAVAAKPLPF